MQWHKGLSRHPHAQKECGNRDGWKLRHEVGFASQQACSASTAVILTLSKDGTISA
jgi:hypothetical protein